MNEDIDPDIVARMAAAQSEFGVLTVNRAARVAQGIQDEAAAAERARIYAVAIEELNTIPCGIGHPNAQERSLRRILMQTVESEADDE